MNLHKDRKKKRQKWKVRSICLYNNPSECERDRVPRTTRNGYLKSSHAYYNIRSVYLMNHDIRGHIADESQSLLCRVYYAWRACQKENR